MIATAIGTHFYWITSRAAGTVALVLASASVGVGLMISGRLGKAVRSNKAHRKQRDQRSVAHESSGAKSYLDRRPDCFQG